MFQKPNPNDAIGRRAAPCSTLVAVIYTHVEPLFSTGTIVTTVLKTPAVRGYSPFVQRQSFHANPKSTADLEDRKRLQSSPGSLPYTAEYRCRAAQTALVAGQYRPCWVPTSKLSDSARCNKHRT